MIYKLVVFLVQVNQHKNQIIFLLYKEDQIIKY